MTPAQRKYRKNQELARAYIAKHPELKNFTSILKKAAATENDVKFSISMGKRINNYTFGSYLSSYTNNPRIRFEMIRDKKHHVPTVSISDSKNGKPVTLICLADMNNLKIETEDCTGCAFDRYSIRFTLEKPTGKLDYDMNIVIGK